MKNVIFVILFKRASTQVRLEWVQRQKRSAEHPKLDFCRDTPLRCSPLVPNSIWICSRRISKSTNRRCNPGNRTRPRSSRTWLCSLHLLDCICNNTYNNNLIIYIIYYYSVYRIQTNSETINNDYTQSNNIVTIKTVVYLRLVLYTQVYNIILLRYTYLNRYSIYFV